MSQCIRESAVIGFNAHLLSLGKNYRNTGISVYIKNVLNGMHDLGTINMNIYSSERELYSFYPNFHHSVSRLKTASPAQRIVWEQLVAPFVCKKDKLRLFHSPLNVCPYFNISGVRHVVTVHDLANFVYPQFYNHWKQKYLTKAAQVTLPKADRLIAVSESTKKDLVEILGIPENKVTVIHNGFNLKDVKAERLDVLLPDEFLLFVGTMEPRKNLANLMRALIKLAEESKVMVPIVLVGPAGWKHSEANELIDIYSKVRQVVRLGYVSDGQLLSLYKKALAFVYPSYYEGFGLPIIEAMSAGVPVICGNNSSQVEVGGDAVVSVCADNYHDIAEKILYVMNNATLRKTMSEKGMIQAKKFDWGKASKQTINVYNELI